MAAHPAAALRVRIAQVLNEASKAASKPVTVTDPPSDEGHEKTEQAALALQASLDAAAGKILEEPLANARQTSSGEAMLPTMLALIGAIRSAAVMPLLNAFLAALGRRRKAAGGAP